MPGHVVFVGSANVDFVMRTPFIPRKGESVNAGPFLQSFGGKGSNQALAARRAGADVTGIFTLGDDVFSKAIMDLYREEGVDARYVRMNPGERSGTGIILVDPNGDNLICTSLEANGRMTPEQVEAAEPAFRTASVLMLQMEVPDEANRTAIALAKRHSVTVILNYAPACESSLPVDRDVDILVVNESEAENLTSMPVSGPEAAAVAALMLGAKGPGTVIITLGGQGSVVCHDGVTRHYPPIPVEVADTTAAGDSYCGALAATLAEGMALPAAIAYATAAGSLCVGVEGALPSLPRREAIEAFLTQRFS
ncbi:MAG: ribokinase [Planctomycetaceae bacterium]|nr:ribokinase [Planctomycetaceae bacterium]